MKVKIFKPFDSSNKVYYHSDKPGMADPSFKQECDIGFMIENYKVNKIPLPSVSVQYGNSATPEEYLRARNMVAQLKSDFELLPSAERDRFGTVDKYLEFIGNPDNLKESYEKGFIDRSTVDLKDVYPERYKNTSEAVNVSSETSEQPPAAENSDGK